MSVRSEDPPLSRPRRTDVPSSPAKQEGGPYWPQVPRLTQLGTNEGKNERVRSSIPTAQPRPERRRHAAGRRAHRDAGGLEGGFLAGVGAFVAHDDFAGFGHLAGGRGGGAGA